MIPKIELMSEDDFYFIKENLIEFWGDRFKLFEPLHHPLFFHSFGNTAFVIKNYSDICAYMLAFYSQKELKGYVHMVNVKEVYRNRGYASALYRNFIKIAQKRGCVSISAITTPQNSDSINFHKRIGMRLLGKKNAEGIPIIKDYAGVGEDRVVFEMKI